ncbi:hypothetical protein [Streptomyces chiangmaiensis]|uniref:Uncharacterized protein n=1 Tax=Streptomyces chiangmaiensis TaxID=766497 RepID=A0ABU7FVI9_9ACTN|nr:hypothetical protein [Streptomyces chiangmaiensis]MED7827813.1 hypothetical protein [Streptomyces chiangmaiensis]
MSHTIPESDLAEALLRQAPRRDTYTGWQNWRTSRRSFVPAPKLTLAEWKALSLASGRFMTCTAPRPTSTCRCRRRPCR